MLKWLFGCCRGAGSSDDDGCEDAPVGFAGVEQCSDAVVVEVGEAVADAFDAFDQVIEGFGGSVADAGDVEVADLVEPGFEGAGDLVEFEGQARA